MFCYHLTNDVKYIESQDFIVTDKTCPTVFKSYLQIIHGANGFVLQIHKSFYIIARTKSNVTLNNNFICSK